MVNQVLSVQPPAPVGSVLHILRSLVMRVLNLPTCHLTVLAICAVVLVYDALILGYEVIMYSAALVSLCALWLCEKRNAKKGSEL